jgi:outer membrane protein assembly factor BamB
VARRPDGSLEVLDLDGGALWTLNVAALGAVLASDDLVVHVRGELRDYSASTGDLRYVWPLPDPSAKLEDVARGVVVYTLDGVVHLFQLSDGAEATVPEAITAELTDAGLFYAYVGEEPWPGRIRFVPFDELPLR